MRPLARYTFAQVLYMAMVLQARMNIEFTCAICNGTDCGDVSVMYTPCKTQCMMRRTLMDRQSRLFWFELKCVADESECKSSEYNNNDIATWCCGFTKCNEPERCPYCSDSPMDNSSFQCPEKPDSGEGIFQTGYYDICTLSSKCISLTQSNWNGTYTYKQKRCALTRDECDNHKCCDTMDCEHVEDVVDSEQYDKNPIFFFLFVGTLGSIMLCVFESIRRNRRQQVVVRKIRVDRGGVGRAGGLPSRANEMYRTGNFGVQAPYISEHTTYMARGLCDVHTSEPGGGLKASSSQSSSDRLSYLAALGEETIRKEPVRPDHPDKGWPRERQWYNKVMDSSSGRHRYRNVADPAKATTNYRQKDRYATGSKWKNKVVAGDTLQSHDSDTPLSSVAGVDSRPDNHTHASHWIPWQTNDKVNTSYYNPFEELYNVWKNGFGGANTSHNNIQSDANTANELYSDVHGRRDDVVGAGPGKYYRNTSMKPLQMNPGFDQDDQYIDDDMFSKY